MLFKRNIFRVLPRTLAFVVVLAVLTGLVTAAPVRAQEQPYALVTALRAPVYAGPGLGFWTFGALRQNVAVPIIGKTADGAFWKADTPIGVGYLSARDVLVKLGDQVEVVDPGPIGSVTTGNLTVRGGPGPDAARIGVLTKGAQFFVVGTQPDGSWIEILFKGGRGWVNASLTSVGKGAGTTVAQPSTNGPVAIVNTSVLNVRTGPSLQYSKLVTLSGGTTVPIVGRTRGGAWLYVETPAGRGWISASAVITRNYFGNAPIIETSTAPLAYAGRTTTSVNVRMGPGLAFKSLGSLPQDTDVNIIGQSRDKAWWYVETTLGKGWINKSVIRTEGALTNVPFVN